MDTRPINGKKLWTCPRCGRHFIRKGQTHSCHVVSLQYHFEGKEQMEKLYRHLLRLTRQETGTFNVDPVACCIHLVKRITFLAIKIKRHSIWMDFTLPEKIRHRRLNGPVQIARGRYLYYTEISKEEEVDKTLLHWISEAYYVAIRERDFITSKN